jgi:hypothetical protein
MRDIGFSFDDDGPSFGKLDAHSTAFRRCADQINEAKAFPLELSLNACVLDDDRGSI